MLYSHRGEFSHQDYFFTEYALAVCSQFLIVYELCSVKACLFTQTVLLLQRLKGEVMKLNQTMEIMTKSSVESSLKKIMDYASRPLPDFNKYGALEMLESLQHTAQDTQHERQNFYRLVYQTVRGMLDVPSDQFRSLVLRLLGDKDHEKSLIVWQRWRSLIARGVVMGPLLFPLYYRGSRGRNARDFPGSPGQALRCFYCGKQGHFKRWCNTRKIDLAMQEKNGASQSATK